MLAVADYEPISVQLTFDAGTSRACEDLNTVVDILVEGSEFLTLELSTDDSSVVLEPRTSSVEIEDDDSECVHTFCTSA